MGKPLVFNIQKYSIHDGEGIRTTVFFKGCPLSCLWCHNPESQSFRQEPLFRQERCANCGACARACPAGAISRDGTGRVSASDPALCARCGLCGEVCLQNARELVGRTYEPEELVRLLEKDRMFYEESGGGVTLSGGEALAQDIDYIEELARRLSQRGISVDFDTCGHVPYERFQRVLPYTDTFLYDIKLMDPEAHRRYMGADNRLILENLRRLSRDGGRINIRLPLIRGVNADDGHIRAVIDFLKKEDIRVCRVNLLKYHATGAGKYEKLGRAYQGGEMAPPSQAWLEYAAELFSRNGFTNIQIGG